MRRSARLLKLQEEATTTPSPPPKKVKKAAVERIRSKYVYDLENDVPVSLEKPDYSLLSQPLSETDSRTLAHSLHISRHNWLCGTMLERYWTRKPRGKKLTEREFNSRDKMTKLCECVLIVGPHTLGAKLFLVREDEEETNAEASDSQNNAANRESKPNDAQAGPSAKNASSASLSTADKSANDTNATKMSEKPDPIAKAAQQLVIYRLQQMAAKDSVLSQLMKTVATGKFTPQEMSLFQSYMAKARAMDAPGKPSMRAIKSTMLAVEFAENSDERFLLPKNAIIEVLPNEDILWSFLFEHEDTYTPVTILLKNLPPRISMTIERCVLPPEKVAEHMKKVMEKCTREPQKYIWHQIEKSDTELIDDIRKLAAPVIQPQLHKKQYKQRRTKFDRESSEPQQESSAYTARSYQEKKARSHRLSMFQIQPEIPIIPPRPKLVLPDLSTFPMHITDLPPLPKSLQGIIPQAPKKPEDQQSGTTTGKE